MPLSFKRITSSGIFIPEIEGLRFIAVSSIVIMHTGIYIMLKDKTKYLDPFDFASLEKLLQHAMLGVPLFFVISGFVLGLPFAKFHIKKEKPINLKKYFIRRLTRLEPPYILILTLLFIAYVFVFHIVPPDIGLKSYFASLLYSHNVIFSGVYAYPLLNPNLWSLEIEIQFYIIAPLLACIFMVKSPSIRRGLLITIAVLFTIFNLYYSLPFLSVLKFFHYFLVGFLLADLYVSKSIIFPKSKYDIVIGLFFFVLIWVFETGSFSSNLTKLTWELIQLASIFFLYYYVIFHKALTFLSYPIVTNIGGMCYSIYMLHSPIIYLFGKYVVAISFSRYSLINFSIYFILIVTAILAMASLFFLLVERPCMERDWYKKIFRRRKFDVVKAE